MRGTGTCPCTCRMTAVGGPDSTTNYGGRGADEKVQGLGESERGELCDGGGAHALRTGRHPKWE